MFCWKDAGHCFAFGEGKATRIIWMTELELWLME